MEAVIGRTGRQLILLVALPYFVLLGGTDAGAALPLAVINGLLAAGAVGWWLWRGGRSDRSDALVLGGLLVFAVTALAALYLRPALDSVLSALAFAATYFLLRDVLADRQARRLLVAVLAVCCLLLGMVFGSLYAAAWAQWISLTGELPPLDLAVRVGFYRHYYLVALLLALTMPALLVWLQGRRTRAFAVIGLLMSVAVIVMSGSRTAWLAVAVGLLVPLVAWFRRRRAASQVGSRALVASVAALAVVAVAMFVVVGGVADLLVDRLLAGATVSQRGVIWGETLGAWAERPLTGHGPGSFPILITLSGYFDAYLDVGRHADSAVIQLLGEGGILGLGGLALAGWGVLDAIRRNRPPEGLPGVMGLAIFAASCLTNAPSDSPSHVMVAIAWAAMAGPRPHASDSAPGIRYRVAAAAGGLLVLVGWALPTLAAASYGQASQLIASGDEVAAAVALDRAIALDPQSALYLRERGLARLGAGDHDGARADLAAAASLNPADATALRALARAEWEDGDRDHAIGVARRAVALRGKHELDRLFLARLLRGSDDPRHWEAELSVVLRGAPWTAAAPSWSREMPTDAELRRHLDAAATSRGPWSGELVEAWFAGFTAADSKATWPQELRALSDAIACRLDGAAEHARAADPRSVEALLVRVMIRRLAGDQGGAATDVALLGLRYQPYATLAERQAPPAIALQDVAEDARLYRRGPLPHPRLDEAIPTASEGLSAWLTDPRGAAMRGAPGSALAQCAATMAEATAASRRRTSD